MEEEKSYCPIEAALAVIGGKWKPHIFRHLIGRTERFGKLQSILPHVTRKVLTQQLRELEEDGIVIRTVYPQVPPKVEYSLSDYGKTLIPIMSSLSGWGQSHVERDNDDDRQVGR
ncbi:transcriptional regulator [Cohnella sp. CFH 77786]|uniref:winged helix-turn-helix transcriptional regulator n=1 Tax=Cohnella sp. CFH 77786 TaxID=2662265 RepID=UPI001C60FF50|nr:helix-turn-helix domain-containing protein [Cohnella sp. CFH 77786]MBW5446205.1 transcriptional regulator [Cohnella sp. CFH 77786]